MNMVGDIYQSVIDDVIAKVAPDFEHESVPDTVLNELKRLWEEKLRQSAVLPQGMNQLMYSQHAYDQSYGSRAMLVRKKREMQEKKLILFITESWIYALHWAPK